MFKGALDWKIQTMKPEDFKKLLFDMDNLTVNQVWNKWNICDKTQRRLRKFYNINTNKINKKETQPESIIRKLLEFLNIEYKREVILFKNRFRVDFLIDNKVIEVHGDYWHSNPKFYNYHSLNEVQWKNYYNDIFKKDWLLNNRFELLSLWEDDIYNNFEQVSNKIKKYLNIQNG